MLNFFVFLRNKFAQYSKSSGQQGTVVDDLAIKPTGLVLAEFYNKLIDQEAINNIENWESMSEESMNSFGGKFFMPRNEGNLSYGVVTIWFDSAKDIEISSAFRAVSNNGLQFKAVQPGFISKSSMLLSQDRFANFRIDVPIIATSKGSAFNIAAGSIVQVTGINFEYKIATNQQDIINGTAHEDNSEYYKRLRYSINDRSMMNKRSVYAKLPELFPSIRSIYVAGAGDFYMRRDLIAMSSLSSKSDKTEYLGKIAGNSSVKSLAFSGIFPPEAGNTHADMWGPVSIPTDYDYPLTIDASDATSTEPAFHGYPLDQEFTNDMYMGLYFDDFANTAELSTSDLFNIDTLNIGYQPVVVPSSEWIYGTHGNSIASFGAMAEGVSDSDVLNFTNNTINISGGSTGSVCAGLDIKKRVGVKLTGTFEWPDSDTSLNSNIQFMVGGISNADFVDAYTGIGFGIRLLSEYVDGSASTNAAVYIAHSQAYGKAQIFMSSDDDSFVSVSENGALAEGAFGIEPLVEYEFEFVIHDDLRVTLYINKVDINAKDTTTQFKTFKLQLPESVLRSFVTSASGGLLSTDNDKYGTVMKVVVDTQSQSKSDTWKIKDLKAVDTSKHKPTALFALNIKDIESPASISMRAYGQSAVNGSQGGGYNAYIWDTEASSPATSQRELSLGAWTYIDSLSDSSGTKYSTGELNSTTLQNFDRYAINSRFGRSVFILVTTTGWSKCSYKYYGDASNDINAMLNVDFIKAVGVNTLTYRSNNKADIYVSTFKNSENLSVISSTITKSDGDSYFVIDQAPLSEILSVSIGDAATGAQAISSADYIIVRSDFVDRGSSNESTKIYLINYSSNSINVQFTVYPEIMSIQNLFDYSQSSKVYGDILIKHKSPAMMDMSVYYSGDISESVFISEIKKYVDLNNTLLFSVKDMVTYMYSNKIVTYIQEPLNISINRVDIDDVKISDTFNTSYSITPIEFFRVNNITVNRI